MSVARFIADQRTNYRVPHTVCCLLLGVSLSWFYKWITRTPTPAEQRRSQLDTAVAEAFVAARGLHGSPRLHADLREAGWVVSEKTVAESMRRLGLVSRRIRRRGGLTKQDKTAPKFPDLLRRDFTAPAPNTRWVGDMTEIPTGRGGRGSKLYLLLTWNQTAGWIVTDRHRHHVVKGPAAREHRGEVARPGPARTSRRVARHLDQPGSGATDDRRVCAGAGGVSAGL